MMFCDFLLYQGFDAKRFTLPLQFWFDLNSKGEHEWFVLTDELIRLIGFKDCESNPSVERSNLLKFTRKHFVDGVDFFTNLNVLVKKGSGGNHKIEI